MSAFVGSLDNNNSGIFSGKLSVTHYNNKKCRIGESVESKGGSGNSDNARDWDSNKERANTAYKRELKYILLVAGKPQ